MFRVLLTLILIRPFISSLAFPYLNSIYSAFLIGFLLIANVIKGNLFRKIQPLKYPLILFCLALIISIVFSSNKLNGLKEVYKYISGLFLFLVVASLDYADRIKVVRTIILAGLIISLLAIYQYLFGFQHILEYIAKEKITDPFVLDYIERKRAFFPFVTPNTLAGYLIMIIPLALINKNRVWFIIPLSFALLLTKSLGALLSIFLASGIYFYLPRPAREVRSLQSRLEKRKVMFLMGLLVTIGLVFITRMVTGKQHLQPIFSMVMRLNYWKETLRIIKAKPLTGVGLGNFNLMLSRYAHNSYLQIWAEMGILGIISFLWLIGNLLKLVLKNTKEAIYKKETAYLVIANFGFLVHNLTDFTFFLPEVSLIWWAILGLLYTNFILTNK